MTIRRTFLAFALLLALAAGAAAALSKHTGRTSVTQSNTTITFNCNAYSVRITNDGPNEVFYDYLDGTATTSDVELIAGESEIVETSGSLRMYQMGVICSTGETSTVRVHAKCD